MPRRIPFHRLTSPRVLGWIIGILFPLFTVSASYSEDAIIDHLELKQTEITQVLQILADASDWTVIPSADVRGQISVYLRDVSASVALEKILHTHGYRFVRDGNTISVMSKAQFEQEYGSELDRRIYPLEFARATDTANQLNQVMSPGSRVIPDTHGNQLVIEEHEQHMDRVSDLIDELDQQEQTRIFPLQHAWVRDLDPAISALMDEPGNPVSDERMNRFIIKGTEQQLEDAENLIRKLDLEDLTETRPFYLTYANSDRIGDMVEDIISSRGRKRRTKRARSGNEWPIAHSLDLSDPLALPSSLSIEAESIRQEARSLGIRGTVVSDRGTLLITHTPDILNRLESFIQQLDTPLPFYTYRFQNLDISTMDLFPVLLERIHTDGEAFLINATLGEVLLAATPERATQLIEWMREIDVPPAQVWVQAHLVRVSHDITRDLGISIRQSFTRSGKPPSPTLDLLFPGDIPDSPKGSIQIGTLEHDDFEIVMEALENERSANRLASPHLSVIDRETANIQLVVDRPFIESLSDANSDVTRESTRFIPIGVTLELTPFISRSGEITLEASVQVSSFLGSSATGAPIVDRSEANTRIRVRDGHTLVIGGLVVKEALDNEDKVPFLGSIPILRHAFKNSHREDSESELLLFITPMLQNFGNSGRPPSRLELSSKQTP